MKPDYLKVLIGDNRATLPTLKAKSIHTCVNSPPYYSVRDYGTEPVSFPAMAFVPVIGLPPVTVPAWRGQLGLEPDPWWFIGHLVLSYRAVRRVLRDDGTLWVNIGDTYHTAAGFNGARDPEAVGKKLARHETPNRMGIEGYRPKDLIGTPWMLARALQADGWILRSDIVWNKPNPMPGSQQDRPTTCHEYVFLFSKRPDYFYDNEAVRQTAVLPPGTKGAKGSAERSGTAGVNSRPPVYKIYDGKRELRTVWDIATTGATQDRGGDKTHYATFPKELPRLAILAGTSERGVCPECGAQWVRIIEETPTPVPDAPDPAPVLFGDPDPVPTYLDRKTVGWRPTCVCGSDPKHGMEPRDLETFETPTGEQIGDDNTLTEGRGAAKRFEKLNTGKRLITRYEHRKYAEQLRASPRRKDMEETAAALNGPDAFEHYMRTDDHGARPIPPDLLEIWIDGCLLRHVRVPTWDYPAPVPATVLDCFGGTATTAEVAVELGRHAIVCELAEHYEQLIERRMAGVTPPLPIVGEHFRA